jgi:hypothetical protein
VLGLAGLTIVVVCHLALARALCRWAGEPRWSVASTLALALAYALPASITRVWPDFVAASLASSAAALVLAVMLSTRPAAPARPGPAAPWSRAAVVLTLLSTTLVVWATIGTRLWDETNAHFGLVRVIARGMVPPAHPLFPQEPFRYHYGFDVLAALPQAFLGLRTDWAIDVATIVCWLALLFVARAVGAELAGRRGADLAVVLVPLGSGLLQIFLFQDFYLLGPRWSALPVRWAESMPPPVISNFFQHPQGLGMSLSLGVALLVATSDPDARTRHRRLLLGGGLLGLASLGQIVFFGVSGLVAGLVVLHRALTTRRWRESALELGVLSAALGLAAALGGFLSPGARPASVLVLGRTYFGEPFPTALVHHLVVFGLPLLAVPLALWARRRQLDGLRLFLAAAAVLGLLVPNITSYERSWDIVKFFGVGAFFANVLLADWASTLPRRATALVLLLSTPAAVVWLLRMSIFNGVLGVHPMQFGPPSPIAVATTAALDDRVGPRERVLSTNIELAMTGGFLTPGFRWMEFGESYMMDRAEAERLTRHHERARHTLAPADLAALDVRWVVLSPGDVASLHEAGRAALADPRRLEKVEDVRVGGDVRTIYRVVMTSTAGATP